MDHYCVHFEMRRSRGPPLSHLGAGQFRVPYGRLRTMMNGVFEEAETGAARCTTFVNVSRKLKSFG